MRTCAIAVSRLLKKSALRIDTRSRCDLNRLRRREHKAVVDVDADVAGVAGAVKSHPIRRIKAFADEALVVLSPTFATKI